MRKVDAKEVWVDVNGQLSLINVDIRLGCLLRV